MAHRRKPVKPTGSRARFHHKNVKKWNDEHAAMEAASEETSTSTAQTLTFARPRLGTSVSSEAATVKYPSSYPITTDTDYVSIDFYNYQPPFGNRPNTTTDVKSASTSEGGNWSQIYENYHHSIGDNALKEKAKGYRSILLFLSLIHI